MFKKVVHNEDSISNSSKPNTYLHPAQRAEKKGCRFCFNLRLRSTQLRRPFLFSHPDARRFSYHACLPSILYAKRHSCVSSLSLSERLLTEFPNEHIMPMPIPCCCYSLLRPLPVLFPTPHQAFRCACPPDFHEVMTLVNLSCSANLRLLWGECYPCSCLTTLSTAQTRVPTRIRQRWRSSWLG